MTTVWVTTQFEALHKWDDAPIEVNILKYPHRHMFHVRLEAEVSHDDRQIEFIMLKSWLKSFVSQWEANGCWSNSCEQFALEITRAFAWQYQKQKGLIRTTVSEDGENGATVEQYHFSGGALGEVVR